MDNEEEIDVIYLDFCKAFDKPPPPPHLYLLKKISAYGIQGKAYGWIKDFFDKRVVVYGSESDRSDEIRGIPQGSVLGPILFFIYINDLPDFVEVLMKLFIDDAKLYHTVTKSREHELQLNFD